MVRTNEDERGVKVFVVLPRIVTVEFFGFFAIYREKVCARVVCPERLKEFFEGGMEARFPLGLSCLFKVSHAGQHTSSGLS